MWQGPGRCVDEGKRNGIGEEIAGQASGGKHGRNGLGERLRCHCGYECGFSGGSVAHDGDSNFPTAAGARGAYHCIKAGNEEKETKKFRADVS